MSAQSATRRQVELNKELKGREMRRLDRALANEPDRDDHFVYVLYRIRWMLHSAKRLTPDQQRQLIEIIKEHVERLYTKKDGKSYILEQLSITQRAA